MAKLRQIECFGSVGDAQFSESQDGNVVITGLVILGPEQKNKRRYTAECMKQAVASGVYEGVQAFINHPTQAEMDLNRRDVRNLAGHFTRPVFHEAELKIKADFVGLPNDPAAKKFLSIAKSMPHLAGLSHNAKALAKIENGIEIVELIEAVQSVDLVARPATTHSMFESENINTHEGVPEMEYTDITLLALKEKRPDLVTLLVKEGVDSRDTEVKKLTEEKTDQSKKLDEFEVQESLRRKTGTIEKLLQESELPDEAVTDVFRESLQTVVGKDDAELVSKVEVIIADRKAFIESVSGGVKNATERQSPSGKTPANGKKGEVKITAQEAAGKLSGRKGIQ